MRDIESLTSKEPVSASQEEQLPSVFCGMI